MRQVLDEADRIRGELTDEYLSTEHLLLAMADRIGVDREQLLAAVWDVHVRIETRTVDMHVQRLRAKLGEAGSLIETVRGFGYRFRSEG